MAEETCYCEDFEALKDEPDMCSCGHPDFEHGEGFFRTCIYNDEANEEP